MAKYKGVDGLLNASAVGRSQFWHSLHKIKHFFNLGAKFSLGGGKLIRFWWDWWTGEGPLKDRFPRLFDISGSPNMLVSHAFDGTGWMIHFRRNFGDEELTQWTALWDEIKDLSPTLEQDKVSWALESAGKFSVASLYRRFIQADRPTLLAFFWEIRVPLKIKNFLWQLARNRLPTREQIQKKQGPSDGKCVLCGETESSNHIFFSCLLARFMWSGVRTMFSVSWNPSSFAELWVLLMSLPPSRRKMLWLFFAAQSWALWNIRNKFSIESIFPNQPADCVFKTAMFLQHWRLLARPEELSVIDSILDALCHLYRDARLLPSQDLSTSTR